MGRNSYSFLGTSWLQFENLERMIGWCLGDFFLLWLRQCEGAKDIICSRNASQHGAEGITPGYSLPCAWTLIAPPPLASQLARKLERWAEEPESACNLQVPRLGCQCAIWVFIQKSRMSSTLRLQLGTKWSSAWVLGWTCKVSVRPTPRHLVVSQCLFAISSLEVNSTPRSHSSLSAPSSGSSPRTALFKPCPWESPLKVSPSLGLAQDHAYRLLKIW